MSTFQTKTADHFIFDESLDPRDNLSSQTPFLRKNVSYVVDQQAGNGSYASGEVIIDSQSISASGNVIDWRNGYIAVPFQTKWDLTWSAAAGTITNPNVAKYALAMKNCSLLQSMKLEANGKTICTATEGLSQLINFKLLSTMTPSSLLKDGAVIGFYPDTEGTLGDAGADVDNVANDPIGSTTLGDKALVGNLGLIQRQAEWLPTTNSNFMTGDGSVEEATNWDYGTTLNGTTTPQRPVDIRWVGIIRLKDLHDYFDSHPLSRGVSYRLTLKFNQAVSTVNHSAATSWNTALSDATTTTLISGNAMPAMFCVGNGTMLSRMTFGNVAATSVITHRIDTGQDTANGARPRFSGVRLYVPSYELDPTYQEKLLSTNPVIKSHFLDFMSQTTQAAAAPGQAINVQVSTSATNPKALIIIPRWSRTPPTSPLTPSELSPYATAPSTPDPLLSLTNVQIKMGNSYVLPDRMYYGFQQFLDHASSIFALNGNQTALTSGLITKKSFETVHRYYAYDLSRYPEAMANLPQMISLECKNNSAQSIELLCILLYERSAEFNIANGSLTITA